MISGGVANVIKGFSRDRDHMLLANFECVRGFDGEWKLLRVEDVEKEVAELMARGVKLEKYDMADIDEKGISTAGGARAAWLKDTEGNIMALIQTLGLA
jgi:hypothetical protein